MTITVKVLTTEGSDPDLYTFLGYIDGAGTDEDPVLNDTSTKFNAEVSLLDAVFVTTGTGFTYDKFGRFLGTGSMTSSTIFEGGAPTVSYTYSAPIKMQDLINGVILFSSGNDPADNFNTVGQPYTFYPDNRTTYLLDNIYMYDTYVFTGNTGDDIFTAGFLNDKLDGKAGNDELHGSYGDDSIIGGTGNDELYGEQGDDTLDGGAGNDIIDGGAQFNGGAPFADGHFFAGDFFGDFASYASVTGTVGVTVSLALVGQQNTIAAGLDTLIDIENLIGSKNADNLTGNDNSNFIEGGGGNDTLDGGANTSGPGDFLVYLNSTSAVTASLLLSTVTSGAGVDQVSNFENLVGTKFNDKLTGDGNGNWIEGYLGNDTMDGGAGGNDWAVYALTPTGVKVDLALQNGETQNTKGAGTDKLAGFENLLGSFHSDNLSGDGGANILWGLDGNDVLLGRGGADTLDGGQGNNTVSYAGSAAVTVDLNIQDGTTGQTSIGSDADGDVLIGIQNVIGSSFGDTLIGDGGNNSLTGAGGADTMTGGSGTDFFRFASVNESNGDVITDFEQGTDKIDLALIDAKTGIKGNQRFKFLGDDVAFTGHKGELHFVTSTNMLEGDTNGDGNADFQIVLTGVTSIGFGDLIL